MYRNSESPVMRGRKVLLCIISIFEDTPNAKAVDAKFTSTSVW